MLQLRLGSGRRDHGRVNPTERESYYWISSSPSNSKLFLLFAAVRGLPRSAELAGDTRIDGAAVLYPRAMEHFYFLHRKGSPCFTRILMVFRLLKS